MSLSSFDTSGVDLTGYDPYGKGIPGLDTSAYSMDSIQSNPQKNFGLSDIAKILGIGAGIAGDVLTGTPKFSRPAGVRLADYFNTSNPNKTSDSFGFDASSKPTSDVTSLIKAITNNYSRYSGGTANPFG
jgi:hypothetical protein